MSDKGVLLVNTGKKPPVARLEKSEGDRLVVVTIPYFAPLYSADTDVRCVDDVSDFKAVRELALDVMRARGISAVVTPSERSLQVGGYLRSYFGLPGASYETVNRFTNKYAMKRFASACGIPVARHRLAPGLADVRRAADEIGWPVVVKPVLGAGSINVHRFSTPAEWEAFAASQDSAALAGLRCPLIVEQYVEMEAEYHCDGVVHSGEVLFASVSRYFEPLLGVLGEVQGSYVVPGQNPDHRRVLELHREVVARFGLSSGTTHMEVFKADAGLLLGEVTCRVAGGGIADMIRLQFGVDLWDEFVGLSVGRGPSLADQAERPGVFVNCHLPVRQGRVTRISTAEEMFRVPGVVDVQMAYRPGDVSSSWVDSSSGSGVVFLRVAEEKDVMAGVTAVGDAFVLETENV